LAYVVKAFDPRVIGRVVIVRAWTDFDLYGYAGWLLEFIGPIPDPVWPKCSCPDEFLRPITPPGLTEEVTEEREVAL
jgi:hypothetical protein